MLGATGDGRRQLAVNTGRSGRMRYLRIELATKDSSGQWPRTHSDCPGSNPCSPVDQLWDFGQDPSPL